MKRFWAIIGLAMLVGLPPLTLAAILNLEVSAAAKVLLLIGAYCVLALLLILQNVDQNLARAVYWTRLAFITLHIRNEEDQLEPAMDRLEQDLVGEGFRREAAAFAEYVVVAVVAASALLLTPVLLYHGVLGPTGQETLRSLIG